MKFTIIKEDNQVGVDGLFFEMDLSSLPENLRAVQWNGQKGHEEWTDKDNTDLTSITKYQSFLNACVALKADVDAKKLNPFHGMSLEEIQENVWLRIKLERERRYSGGVKVMGYWFETDPISRIKFMGLKDELNETQGEDDDQMYIDDEPLFWKTMNNLFVPMSRLMLKQIIQKTKILDKRVFKAAENHKSAMMLSSTPETYDYSVNWPERYKDFV